MERIACGFGAVFGFLALIFGAFGAHALKKHFSQSTLANFETGVRYQMYHALALLVVGMNLHMNTALESFMVFCFVFGTFLFSFSIYALCISSSRGRNWRFLGPVTPIGGLLLAAGWAILVYRFFKGFLS